MADVPGVFVVHRLVNVGVGAGPDEGQQLFVVHRLRCGATFDRDIWKEGYETPPPAARRARSVPVTRRTNSESWCQAAWTHLPRAANRCPGHLSLIAVVPPGCPLRRRSPRDVAARGDELGDCVDPTSSIPPFAVRLCTTPTRTLRLCPLDQTDRHVEMRRHGAPCRLGLGPLDRIASMPLDGRM